MHWFPLLAKIPACQNKAAIAQLGERQTEDLKVPGSIPGLGTYVVPNAPRGKGDEVQSLATSIHCLVLAGCLLECLLECSLASLLASLLACLLGACFRVLLGLLLKIGLLSNFRFRPSIPLVSNL